MKRWPLWGKLVSLVLAFILIVSGIVWWAHLRARQAWEDYQAQLAVQGESLDWKDFLAPKIPDEENLALTPIMQDIERLKALLPITNLPGWIRKLPSNYAGWMAGQSYPFGELYDPHSTGTPLSREATLDALSKFYEDHRSAYQEVATTLECTGHWKPITLGALEFDGRRKLGQILQAKALYHVAIDQSELALQSWQRTLLLTGTKYSEYPCALDHLVRITDISRALQPLHDGLSAQLWTESQLSQIDDTLRTVDLITGFQDAFRGERASALWLMNNYYEADVADFAATAAHPFMKFVVQQAPGAIIPWNLRTVCRNFQRAITILESCGSESFRAEWIRFQNERQSAERQARDGLKHQDWLLWLTMGGMLDTMLSMTLRTQCYVDLARIAVAAERFRLAKGHYPDKLDQLSPRFLKSIPLDRITGQSLHYVLEEDGLPQFYSFGWNTKDDARKVYKTHEHGDWVWRYTDEGFDIQDYKEGR